MLTYSLDDRGDETLYGYLYRCIRADIESGAIVPGAKLPSKRALAKHLGVSVITVEGAYRQLVAEGYVDARPRSGYFANAIAKPTGAATAHSGAATRAGMVATANVNVHPSMPASAKASTTAGALPVLDENSQTTCANANVYSHDSFAAASPAPSPLVADLAGGSVAAELFPLAAWSRTVRDVLAHEPEHDLLSGGPSMGSPRLRQALAEHLRAFRGMDVAPECVVVGSGAQTLYNLIVQLLGRDKRFAVEDPGYPRLTQIYRANDVALSHVGVGPGGIDIAALEVSGADVVHLMPSHQFPLGIVTPVSRRYELLGWAAAAPGRFIVEDDYDCEFRLAGRPIPTMQSIDVEGRVIYANTFSRSLGPSFRIAYAVLPPALAERFERDLGFYSNTVPTVDQLALARFIESGDFERHLNRMRNHYRTLRDELVGALEATSIGSRIAIEGADGGLHFLLHVDSPASEQTIVQAAQAQGVRVRGLSAFCQTQASQTCVPSPATPPEPPAPAVPAPAPVTPPEPPAFACAASRNPTFVVSYAALARESAPAAAAAFARAVLAAERATEGTSQP